MHNRRERSGADGFERSSDNDAQDDRRGIGGRIEDAGQSVDMIDSRFRLPWVVVLLALMEAPTVGTAVSEAAEPFALVAVVPTAGDAEEPAGEAWCDAMRVVCALYMLFEASSCPVLLVERP